MISASTSSATLRVLENGALKTGMPRSSAARQVHLVGADAEAADPGQPRSVLEEPALQLRGRADADEVRVGGRLFQRRPDERFLVALDVVVAILPELLDGAGMDAFEQQDLDLGFIQRGLGHARSAVEIAIPGVALEDRQRRGVRARRGPIARRSIPRGGACACRGSR